MSEMFDLAAESEIPVGSMRLFVVGERRVVVYHTDDGFFATDDACPHRGGPLSEGDLLDGEVICPWHLWSFDVRTGCNDLRPQIRVATYEVRAADGRIGIVIADEEGATA